MAQAQISIIAEAQQAISNIGAVGKSADDMGSHFTSAAKEVKAAGEHLEHLGSKSSQAAGGIGDLGGALTSWSDSSKAAASASDVAAAAAIGVKEAQMSLEETQSAVTDAQKAYNDAVGKSGASSQEATGALAELKSAQIASEKAQLGLNQAQRDAEPPSAIAEWGAKLEGIAPLLMGAVGAMDLLSLAANANAISWARNAAAQVASKAALIAGTVATVAATVANAALNFVLALNPITLIIIAVIALIAIIVLMVKHWDKVKAFLLAVWDAIKVAAEATWNGIKAVIMFVATWVVNYIKLWIAIVKGVWSGITWLATKVGEVVGAVVNWFKGLPGKIMGFLTGIIDKMKNIGKSIMKGIADGIQAGLAWVREKIGSLGSLLPDWLEKILGISSPSRVFRSIGVNVMEGLSLGIEQGASKAVSALTGVSANMTKALSVQPTVDFQTVGTSRVEGTRAGTVSRGGRDTINITLNGIATSEQQVMRGVELGLKELKRVRGSLEFQS